MSNIFNNWKNLKVLDTGPILGYGYGYNGYTRGSGTKLDLRVRIGSGNRLLVTGRVGYQKAFTRRPLLPTFARCHPGWKAARHWHTTCAFVRIPIFRCRPTLIRIRSVWPQLDLQVEQWVDVERSAGGFCERPCVVYGGFEWFQLLALDRISITSRSTACVFVNMRWKASSCHIGFLYERDHLTFWLTSISWNQGYG
jgi:hypothetical protein